jgi:HSP20 family molecular chaperone IbpA
MTARMFTSPLFLGFDHLEQMLERASKASSDGYPPYNIEQTGPTGSGSRSRLPAYHGRPADHAGDNQLVIRGRQTGRQSDRVFPAPRIAARQFQRAFVLAEGSIGAAHGSRAGCCTSTLPGRSPSHA